MGAAMDTRTYEGDVKDLPEWWRCQQEDDRYKNGHDSYTGTIGSLYGGVHVMKIDPFTSMDAAYCYLEQTAAKGETALAVPYKGKVTVPFVALRKALERRDAAQTKLKEAEQAILKAMKSTKSKTIGCKKCGSSITRSYLRLGREWPNEIISHNFHGDEVPCPVCYSNLMSLSNQKRMESARTAITRAKNECHELRDRKDVRDGVCYLVGGLCRM